MLTFLSVKQIEINSDVKQLNNRISMTKIQIETILLFHVFKLTFISLLAKKNLHITVKFTRLRPPLPLYRGLITISN